jgi:hypothetical protein
MECLFQSKALGNGEDAVTVAASQHETLDVEEDVESRTLAGASE